MKYDINELYPSARHAYNAIGLAVKTSRPQYVNELFYNSVPFFQKDRAIGRTWYLLISVILSISSQLNINSVEVPKAVGKDTPKSIPKKVLTGVSHMLHLRRYSCLMLNLMLRTNKVKSTK